MKSLQSFQNLCLCGLSCATYSENFYPYLLNGRGRRRKWQKRLLKSELALFPSSLLLFHAVQFVKCRWSFLNSKGLFQCYEKHTTSLSCVHALHKAWNKAVAARRSGAASDGIKIYKKVWFGCIVVVLLFWSSRSRSLLVNRSLINRASEYKYLGVILGALLTWNAHVEYLLSKVRKRLTMLGRIRKNINMYTAGTVYKSFVLPILDYCDTVWSCCGSVNADKLEKF